MQTENSTIVKQVNICRLIEIFIYLTKIPDTILLILGLTRNMMFLTLFTS